MLNCPFSGDLYKELYCILRQVCEEFGEGRVFSGFFALLGVVCDENGISAKTTAALQNLRRRAGRADGVSEQTFLADARLLAEFVCRLYGVALPQELAELLPPQLPSAEAEGVPAGEYKVLRVRVLEVGETRFTALTDTDGDNLPIEVDFGAMFRGGDLLYIGKLLRRDSVVNLLKVRVETDGVYVPDDIVYEPDYLMSPSEIAAVFEPYGASPYNYFIKMFSPFKTSAALLLGNVSGVFLDELLGEAQRMAEGDLSAPVGYAGALGEAFRKSPVEFSFMLEGGTESMLFHENARRQFLNIKNLLQSRMIGREGFDMAKALLEPSFVCPALGLAGRMDYLQSDGTRLIEQKSGKKDEFHNTHHEKHYVQVLLYRLMIEYCMGTLPRDCRTYLLYSLYPDGLMHEAPYTVLQHKAMEVRNHIVSMVRQMADGGLVEMMSALKTDDLRASGVSDKFWDVYCAPNINNVLGLFSEGGADPLTLAYVARFHAFISREHWLSKVGSSVPGSHGYADLWNNPALVKIEGGDMYAGLKIKRLRTEGGRVEAVCFALSADMGNSLTNFRRGDAVQIYSYAGGEPSVSEQFTLRGRLNRIEPTELEVTLNNPQHRASFADVATGLFALEHDHVDAGYTTRSRALFGLLRLSTERQRSFLLTSLPAVSESSELVGSYGEFDPIVRKQKSAREWFVLIGPPGSGKTSRAIRFMIEEQLRSAPGGSILLMAYTNRAVDELCGMLEEIITDNPDLFADYLRIGNPLSASAAFHARMLSQRVADGALKAAQVRQLVLEARIVVGTIATMSSQQVLFDKKAFDLAVIDEASQVLEPDLLPVYTQARVGRYVLVGDQKQLPAVVAQSRDESAVSDEALNAIDLHDCAESLFARMLHTFIRRGRADLYDRITTQGRMHPEILDFVNSRFYGNAMRCVPLNHQRRSLSEIYPCLPPVADTQKPLVTLLATNRVVFFDCQPVADGLNDKVNSAEARLVADCLGALAALAEANGRTLRPDDVGIIVPYRNQITMIRQCLEECGLSRFLDTVIDTVERYQGSQRDIIICSFTVRHESQLGFLTSSSYFEDDGLCASPYAVDRKLNVTLTRSREQLIMIGNKRLLSHVELFAALIALTEKKLDLPQ